MASTKTTLKTVRIANEAVEYFRDKTLNRLIEATIPLLESGELSFDGEELKISGHEGVHTEKTVENLSASPEKRDIEQMLSISGITMEEFYRDIDGFMNEGTIDVSTGRIQIAYPDWVNEFAEVCHDCGIGVEEAMSKAAKALRRGSI